MAMAYTATMPAPRSNRADNRVYRIQWYQTAMWLAAHAAFALVAGRSSALATLHALAILGYGCWIAYNRRLLQVAFVGAYITGGEVFWRMCHAHINWEFGKYAIILIFGVALARTRKLTGPLLPLLYFVFLLPSIWVSGQVIEWHRVIELMSFYLSGPLALLLCAWLFRRITLTPDRLRMLFLAMMGPVVSIATKALFTTFAAGPIEFSTESNSTTAGGFGPNQVSPMLGITALIAVFYLMSGKLSKPHRLIMMTLSLILVMQSGLTFSRSGLVMALASMVVASMFLLQDTKSRLTLVLVTAFLYLFVNFLMVPVLDDFTGGAFTKRFTDKSPSHRDQIAMSEIHLWLDHPILGVGPGGASTYREAIYGVRVATHTEYTRMLAEHGAFGVFSLVCMLASVVQNFLRTKKPKPRAVVVAMLMWSLLFFSVNAFRLVAPAFAFGLTFTTFLFPDRKKPDPRPGRPGKALVARPTPRPKPAPSLV